MRCLDLTLTRGTRGSRSLFPHIFSINETTLNYNYNHITSANSSVFQIKATSALTQLPVWEKSSPAEGQGDSGGGGVQV